MITAGLALVVLGATAAYAVSTAGRLEPAALAGGAMGIVLLAVGQPTAALAADQSITFVPNFVPVKGHTYTIVSDANEPNGHSESRTATVTVK